MKKSGLLSRLKSNYVKIFIFSFLLLFIPFSIIKYGIKLIAATEKRDGYQTAQTLIKDSYKDIDLKGIEKACGMAQVVTEDRRTIVLCGEGICADGTISEKEWVDLLLELAGKKVFVNDKYLSIAYSEKGRYWLIVSYKNNAYLTLTVYNNTYKCNSIKEIIFLGIMLVIAVISYILGMFLVIYYYSYRTTVQLVKQFQSLKDYTVMLRHGEYKGRIEIPMDREILELKEAFHGLAYSLEQEKNEKKQSEDSKKRLLIDISHDLNNPIATIRSSSEILLTKEEMKNDLRKKYCEIINNNSIRAQELLKSLFDYVKLDGPDFILHKEKVDLCELIRLEIIRYQPEFEAAQMVLDSEIPEKEVIAAIDFIQMKNVLYNLFTNAIKYNKAGTRAAVILEEREKDILLYIKDDGIGINAQTAKTIFEPFTRVDKARNSKTGGSGLGLAIVRKILDAHGFGIELITGTDKGCTFIIEIPAQAEAG